MLAAVEAKLPPIIVHRATMRVIDGMHRLAAAKLRNDETIEVRFFEGTEQEAFVLAVKANISHGRPLSLTDRTSAAERIIVSHPAWSDRAIAVAAGSAPDWWAICVAAWRWRTTRSTRRDHGSGATGGCVRWTTRRGDSRPPR